MAATRASGTNAVRYGTMKDNVLALKVVLANGEVMSTARRAKKSSAGYDLTRLLVGSEGTLGVITELTLRLAGIPEAIASGVCPFPSVEAACNATIPTIQSGIPVARIELLDALQVQACNPYSKLDAAGNADAVRGISRQRGERRRTVAALRRHRARARRRPVRLDDPAEDRTRLWQARHDAYWAARGLRPGRSGAGDRRLRADLAARRMRRPKRSATSQRAGFSRRSSAMSATAISICSLLIDLADADEVKRAKAFLERLVERALAMDGTCTGEHGVGQGKMKYLQAEHGEPALAAMRAHQARARSAEYLESRQDLPAVSMIPKSGSRFSEKIMLQ